MTGSVGALLMVQANSARAIAAVYAVSLLATLPLVIAAVLAFLLRRASAEARALVWRAAIGSLLVVIVGRQVPVHWIAGVVPSVLAGPLVALGRMQVTAASAHSIVAGQDVSGAASYEPAVVFALLAVYLAGVASVAGPTLAASITMRRSVRRGRARVADQRWLAVVSGVRRDFGLRRPVRLFITRDVTVPMTWGCVRPTVVLPIAARGWDDDHRRIVLLHEIAHVQAADWLFNLAAQVACALLWFHPGVWWVARGLREDCELACDDRVILSGVRRSDYAELLVGAAEMLRSAPGDLPRGAALALSRRRGLRARLAALVDSRHEARPLARGWATVAVVATLGIAGPVSVAQLAPTRAVLTTLMLDAHWESRAYAVLGLAQRADSVAVARSAAELDPSPRVRAWARYALGQRGGEGDALPDLRTIIRDR